MNSSYSELINDLRKHFTRSDGIIVFCYAALLGLLTFAWDSHSVTLFNGLATPLTYVVCGYLLIMLVLSASWVVEKKNLVIILVLLLWILIADAQSGQFLPALARDTQWLLAALLAVSVPSIFRRLDHVIVVLKVASATCILALLITMFIEADIHIDWHRPPIFGHIRHLGLTIGLFTLLLYMPSDDGQKTKLLFGMARIVGMSLVIWSGTRASILGMVFALVIAGLLLKEKQFFIQVVSNIAIATLLAMIPPPALPGASGLHDILGRTIQSSSLNQASSFRLSMWTDTINWLAINKRLFLGAGGNGFARIQTLWNATINPPGHVQPHNALVQILTDWGIPGLVLSLSLISSILQSSIKYRRTEPSLALVFGALSYLFVTSMFDATLYHLEFLIYFSVLIGTIAIGNQSTVKGNTIRIPKSIIVVALIAVIGIHLSTTDYRIGLSWYFPTE